MRVKAESAAPATESRLAITYLPLKSLVPYAKNARTHSPVQISKLKASLAEYGWANPMLVADNIMIAGHGRLQAALEMAHAGMAIPHNPDPWKGPTVDLSHLTPTQRKAYILQDNRSALDAGWDEDLLAMELGDLQESGFDLSLTGFEEDDISRMLGGSAPGDGADPDQIPEVPVIPTTVLGDVWCLGRHRLCCGDSTDSTVVAKVLNGVQPHLMITDPPYGVDYDPEWRHRNGLNNSDRIGKVSNDSRADWSEAWALFPGDVAYVWHGERQLLAMGDQLQRCNFEPRNLIVWAKSRLVISRGHYHSQHETCWYAVRKGSTAHWAGDRKQTTLWSTVDKGGEDMKTTHGTQKPVELMRRAVLNNSSAGQAVYEPFAGSFTTGIACEVTGRACHAIELSPQYVDVGVLRWQGVTGLAATLDGDGRTFDEIAADRAAASLEAADAAD